MVATGTPARRHRESGPIQRANAPGLTNGDSMSHEIETMSYVGQTPWHGLGNRLEVPPATAREAMIASGLDWTVEKRPAYFHGSGAESGNLLQASNFCAIVRDSDNAVLGMATDWWKPLQNIEAFEFFDPFIANGAAEYHTAGSLRGGQRVWVLAKLAGKNATVAKGDELERYFLLSNGHDGKTGIVVQLTGVRVVCNNTLTYALKRGENGQEKALSINHLGNVQATLKAVQSVVDLANNTFAANLEQYRYLASKQVRNIERFVIDTIGKDGDFERLPSDPEKRKAAMPRATAKIINLFDQGLGNQLPSVAGSYWAAVNGVTQWVDHERGGNDTRLEAAWFGAGRDVKNRAVKVAMELAAAA
jgi:phage/plasmid-like protein (TIGR03299 family)